MCLPLSSLPQGFEMKRDRFKLLTACFVKTVSEGGYDVGVVHDQQSLQLLVSF